MAALHELERSTPVRAVQFLRRLLHLGVAPRELALGDRDELGGGVGDPLERELAQQRAFADRVTDERAVARELAVARLQRLVQRAERCVSGLVGGFYPPREQDRKS